MSSTPIVIALLALALAPRPAAAAELRILAGGSMTTVLTTLAPAFEKASGHTLAIHFDSTPNLIKQALAGPFDLGIVPVDVLADPAARARFAPEPPTPIAHVGYGIAIRAGAARPDLSTPDAFRQSLLDAKSIAFLPTSAAGAQVVRVFEQLGIGDAMKAKTLLQPTPADIPKAVAAGQAELGVFLINVLTAPGVELAGPFPPPLQTELAFTGAVAAAPPNAEAARAFIAFMASPGAVAVIKAKGMTPG